MCSIVLPTALKTTSELRFVWAPTTRIERRFARRSCTAMTSFTRTSRAYGNSKISLNRWSIMASVAETVETARRYHQAGALPQAEQLYRQVLQVEPNHGETLYLLGALAYQVGDFSAAEHYIRTGLATNPSDGRLHSIMGLVQLSFNRADEAVASLSQAVNLMPAAADAHYNLARALHKQGKRDEAVASYEQALRLKPDFGSAHNNLGSIRVE